MASSIDQNIDNCDEINLEASDNEAVPSCPDDGGTSNTTDVVVRWNSTWKMLENAIKYEEAFTRYALLEPGYKYLPTTVEWNRARRIALFLEPFNEITNLFSGSKYCTANLYFENVWKIQIRLLEELMGDDIVLCEMAKEMVPKFNKYWESYSLVLSMAIVLDPRYKLQFVKFCHKKVDDVIDNLSDDLKNMVEIKEDTRVRWEAKMVRILDGLKMLFQQYVSEFETQVPRSQELQPRGHIASSSISTKSSLRDESIEFDLEDHDISKRSELDSYLEERKMDRRENKDMDVLKYWKDNSSSSRYQILSRMARDLLSIPITTVASESAFSMGGKVLNKYRSSLLPENAEALICTRTWMCGFDVESDELTDEQLYVPLPMPMPMQDSNSTTTTAASMRRY